MGRVFKRRIRGADGKSRFSEVWYAWISKPGGGVKRVSTNCADKQAAIIVAAKLERASVDPDYAAQNEAQTPDVLAAYLASRKRLGRAEGTLHHVRVKAGHLIRLLPARLASVTHSEVERYIDTRLAEGAARTTIKKETRVLKAALRLAAKNDLFKGDPNNVIPELEDDYEPRTRYLSPWELVALVNALPTAYAGMVAFIVATSARWGEAVRFDRGQDITRADGLVYIALRGTKTKAAARTVPIMGAGLTLLEWSLARLGGGRHWPAWSNVRRDLIAACGRVGMAAVSPNDLRRTFATWLQQEGIGNDLIAKAMGHVDTRMVERVYGRMTPRDLARLMTERRIGGNTLDRPGRLMVENPGVSSLDALITATLAVMNSADNTAFFAVPRDGIEPPTRGFSSLQAEMHGDTGKEAPSFSLGAGSIGGGRLMAAALKFAASEWKS